MQELDLIKLWNKGRAQIISSHLAPTIILGIVIVLGAIGEFQGASDALKWFTLAVIAVSGILATLSQYATIREGAAIASELKEAKGTSKVGKVIGNSQAFTLLTTALIFLIDIAVFGLAIWLVLDA